MARSSASWPTRQERSGLRRRIKEGDSPADVHLVLSGFACRYKLLRSGDRQIMAWLVPGDICDLHVSILGEMDHAIGTLTPCQIAFLPRHVIEELTSGRNAHSSAVVGDPRRRGRHARVAGRHRQAASRQTDSTSVLRTAPASRERGAASGDSSDFPATQWSSGTRWACPAST
ncbi:cyclic nucleotide-binding domain-containing protein [Bradyrhizobium sp. 30]|nr:cyclic nucleotide-binding domain-containing protein [Bradyrhizobium sp. 30]